MKRPLYVHIATALGAFARCVNGETVRPELAEAWSERLDWIEKNLLPSGSGVDSGTKIDRDRSTPDRIVLTLGFHHMNDGGFYDGWTDHEVIVKASLQFGADVRITGRNRNDIKDYLHQMYHDILFAERDEADFPTLFKE